MTTMQQRLAPFLFSAAAKRAAWAGCLLLAAAAYPASAAFPDKPVRVVIVFAPSGSTDIVGRVAYGKVGQQLNLATVPRSSASGFASV